MQRQFCSFIRCAVCVTAAVLGAVSTPAANGSDQPAGKIDFNRQIRPILSEYCFACHGPDEKTRRAGLRLDLKEDALAELRGGGRAIVPGDPHKSLLIERVTTTDESEIMPPPKTGKHLNTEQVGLLRQWIEQGAAWDSHWAFVKPQRPAVPDPTKGEWARNPIDRFILKQLDQQRFEPSAEADRITLIRRLSLDLLGLPPAVEQVDAFVADTSPDAYEKLVNQLLASPHYGERMAQDWLDVARYGDTNGYHFDSDRSMWPYRDYVIKAFNDNKPFDRFTIENIAGDLLPDATTETQVASGFNRNCTYNEEGGADPDEFMVQYAVDRVNTTGTAFLGLTIACAQCHDHKYDPISQKDFYQLYAFFNSVAGEKGAEGHDVALPPLLKLPTAGQKAEMEKIQAEKASLEKALADRPGLIAQAINDWERQTRERLAGSAVGQGLLVHYEFDAQDARRISDASGRYRHGTHIGGEPIWTAGKIGGAIKFDGKGAAIDAGEVGDFERTQAFSYGCWVNVEGQGGVMIARMNEGQDHRGYDVGVVGGRIWAHIIHAWPANGLKVTSKATVPTGQWHHVMVTYDGSGKAAGVRVYLNGAVQDVEINNDTLSGSIRTSVPTYIGKRNNSVPFHGAIDDVRIYDRFLTAAEVAELAGPATLNPIIATASSARTAAEQAQLTQFYLENHDPEYRKIKEQIAAATAKAEQLDKSITSTMIMQEMSERRPAFVLVRGDFQNKADAVEPNTPLIFPPIPAGQPRNRIGLAYWLIDRENPLTARVFVNRLWQHFFGTGLVKTAEDFGVQGELPSHPELLDWLAVEFIESGWDIKKMVRLMITSATYRQSSVVKGRHYDQDPYNRLLYRAPRLRLAAEQIRDNALSISGLLNPLIGGPSVKPYQPDGYYKDKGRWTWDQSKGQDLYRRGLYTFWRRTTFYPSFQVFDAPSREICTVNRPRTNTPLQALVTLNDPAFVEAARVFAQRIMRQGGTTVDDKLVFAFRTALARPPSPAELRVLQGVYHKAYDRYMVDIQGAIGLTAVGESANPEELNLIEHAAWTAVANTLLNLDETIMRG